MQSKRKRVAGHQEETAEQLLKAYRDESPVSRDGKHAMLRWLVMACSYEPLDDVPPCPMDRANAIPFVPTADQLEEMEQAVATRVMASEQPEEYLNYAAHFFKWWDKIAAIASTPRVPPYTGQTCAWLSERDIERSLVVPDIRRGAIKLAQKLEVRAGESHVAAAQAGNSRSCSATLQALRTGEWNGTMHQTLMYATATEIYNRGLLSYVYFAMIHGRYLGRLNFAWADVVLVTPSTYEGARDSAWPLIYVHGSEYLVQWGSRHSRCANAALAFNTWVQMCIDLGGIIGGRYDVRKCTI